SAWLTTRLLSFPDSKVRHVYDMDDLKGYSGHFSPALVDDIRQRPEVAYVERDQVMQVLSTPFLKPKGLSLSREPVSEDTSQSSPSPSSSYKELWYRSPRHSTLEQSMISALSRWFDRDKGRAGMTSGTPSKQQFGAPWGLA